jgi:glutathione S-transferase
MPNYTLNYFNGRGRAELTRLIFTAAGAAFTDNRIADWPATKDQSPLGQLPYLAVDDVKLPQSIAIARFAAREFNLAGRTILEQVTLLLFSIQLFKNQIITFDYFLNQRPKPTLLSTPS